MMLYPITVQFEHAVQRATAATNAYTQSIAQELEDFCYPKTRPSWRDGRAVGLGTQAAARAVMPLQVLGTYVLGRGFKACETTQPTNRRRLEQHGVVGLSLRYVLAGLGSCCGLAPERNAALLLADAVMAAARLVCVSTPAAMVLVSGWSLGLVAQLTVDTAGQLARGATRAAAWAAERRSSLQAP